MKIGLLILAFALALSSLVGCAKQSGETVADPKARFDYYVAHEQECREKMKECKLMSPDQLMKSQECELARKALVEISIKNRQGSKMSVSGSDGKSHKDEQ